MRWLLIILFYTPLANANYSKTLNERTFDIPSVSDSKLASEIETYWTADEESSIGELLFGDVKVAARPLGARETKRMAFCDRLGQIMDHLLSTPGAGPGARSIQKGRISDLATAARCAG